MNVPSNKTNVKNDLSILVTNNDEEKAQQQFTWLISDFQKYQITIKLNFENPSEISSYSDKDFLEISFIRNNNFRASISNKTVDIGTKLKMVLPLQYKDESNDWLVMFQVLFKVNRN